jgi:2',3'-cyclic-nucleotide 2'-phosphodiesterase (5'-nucleotidase family)
MLLINRRLATGLLLVPIGIRFAGAAPDATARITFILVNDINLMADELMPDGQRRGGFARLAAVVKAERAKASATSGHVIFAHGGDTLSPSLMSVTREQGNQIFRGRAVDLLLTGHTHDLFIEHSGRNAMVESSYDAHYVTAIDIVIDVSEESGRRRVRWWPQFRVIDTAMATPDPEVAAIVAKFEDELNKELDAPIGATAVELDSRAATVRTREAAIGNLIADAMRWSAQTEVAVTNGGGIRGDKIYPPGTTITRREVLAELPFGNRLVTIDVLGSALKAAIENGLSLLPAPSGRFPQVAGLKIEADPSRPAGNRVLSIVVGDTPLDANKTYSVATIDFMARGGDDYVAFRDAKPVLPPADSPTVAYEVIDYIKSIGTIRTGVDGRIVLK